MLNQISGSAMIAHPIKYDIDTFSPSEFCCGHKIGICCYDDNLIDLALKCQ